MNDKKIKCDECDGEGGVDSGGFTPWDAPIDIMCGKCKGEGIVNDKNWWNFIQAEQKPVPHIPEKRIKQFMPEDIYEKYEKWIYGQTGLHCDDGDFGVYSWDFCRFIGKYKRGEKLEDNLVEWD